MGGLDEQKAKKMEKKRDDKYKDSEINKKMRN